MLTAYLAQKIRDQRLGEKIQILRTLRILEKQRNLPKDLKILKGDVVAALDSEESETLGTLNELQAADSGRRRSDKLSEDMRTGLQFGRQTMLRRLEELEEYPSESRERAFVELKTRSSNLLTKL